MKSKIVINHFLIKLSLNTIFISLVLLLVLLYANLIKHEEYLGTAISVSRLDFIHLCFLLVPYAFSYALPFGFVLSIMACFGKWSSSNEILALRSLGQNLFSWGRAGFFLSLIVTAISLFIFLQWGPTTRAKFDLKKSQVLWSDINSVLKTEKEIDFEINPSFGDQTFKNLSSFSNEPIKKVSLSVGSLSENRWNNLRVLLFGEKGKLLRIINSKHAFVEIKSDNTELSLRLKDVDLESSFGEKVDNKFVSFKEWNQPLVFKFGSIEESINLKRLGFLKLLEISKSKSEKAPEAKNIINKNIALGSSSFFLFLIILPLSITKGRKEGVTNLSFGIFISVLYFVATTFFAEFSIISNIAIICWIPNAICFIIGTYLLYNFERSK